MIRLLRLSGLPKGRSRVLIQCNKCNFQVQNEHHDRDLWLHFQYARRFVWRDAHMWTWTVCVVWVWACICECVHIEHVSILAAPCSLCFFFFSFSRSSSSLLFAGDRRRHFIILFHFVSFYYYYLLVSLLVFHLKWIYMQLIFFIGALVCRLSCANACECNKRTNWGQICWA